LGTKVKASDEVRTKSACEGEKPVYILLNKPKGFITNTEDPQERNTVMGLVAGALQRAHLSGRPFGPTNRILLLTNDGDWQIN